MESHYRIIESSRDLEWIIAEQPATAVYFTGPQCGVCEVLKPKIAEMIRRRFPRLGLYVVDSSEHADISAAHGVFSVPALLIFFDGREWLRKSRNLSMTRLEEEIRRPYQMIFSDAVE
ncbi:MAG TPA: thioredoxin [Chromatiales bacterium]|nr:thioredoxin [Chromatiales bacterium]